MQSNAASSASFKVSVGVPAVKQSGIVGSDGCDDPIGKWLMGIVITGNGNIGLQGMIDVGNGSTLQGANGITGMNADSGGINCKVYSLWP